ncbi:hypothetical protein CHS0354_012085 [Potamilus streckersoni]|uniref:Uncharacterized protein n=1 Tax=Potamilus streckersoni TaxID=2493646 RepID=A0AAE0SA21_9BIVA|nr:hypothetical protein CHS0354_012085 [Potamilus streckersoni]
MKLKDDQGRDMPAMKVFSESIRYLKDHLLESLRDRYPDTRDTDIYWVITVLAFWDDGAKQFMREAGNKDGIPNNQLDLALEPEAAAICCKSISVKLNGSSFEPGTQFILVDLGGGTADMTIHVVRESGCLTELSPPSGGPWGGTKVDAAFDKMVEEIYGKSAVSSFIQNSKADDLDLKREFELKKRLFDGEKVNFRSLRKLNKILKKNGQSLENKLSGTIYEGKVMKKADRVYVAGSIMSEMFEDVKENIIQHMRELLRQHPDVNMIIMVGGFSDSNIIKKAVREAFCNKTVIIPDDAVLAVLKEAVMYRCNTSLIISRSIPFTYGVSVAVPFDVNKHPESKKMYKDGYYKCEDNFKVFFRAGETVIPGKTTVQYICNASTATRANVEIYGTKSKYPLYVDEPECRCIGSVQLLLNDSKCLGLRPIHITMSFESTELSVRAEEEGTINAVMAKFNFLN